MRPTDPDDRVPWERLLPVAVVIWAIALIASLACATPLEARQCPKGWVWVTQVDTAGWMVRANGDTVGPITVTWDGCFQEDV